LKDLVFDNTFHTPKTYTMNQADIHEITVLYLNPVAVPW